MRESGVSNKVHLDMGSLDHFILLCHPYRFANFCGFLLPSIIEHHFSTSGNWARSPHRRVLDAHFRRSLKRSASLPILSSLSSLGAVDRYGTFPMQKVTCPSSWQSFPVRACYGQGLVTLNQSLGEFPRRTIEPQRPIFCLFVQRDRPHLVVSRWDLISPVNAVEPQYESDLKTIWTEIEDVLP